MSNSSVNVVLVHGAFVDGSSWSKVIPILQSGGHNVVAVQNELMSLKDDSENTRATIDAMPGPTVVVGHSYGGAVITSAASGASNVVGLVYVAAVAPDEGESVNDVLQNYPPSPVFQYIAPGPRGLLYIDRAHVGEVFAGDLPAAEAAVLAATQRPLAATAFGDKMGPPAWKQHKSWYQISENDEAIPPDAERWMATRIGATTISLPSSHASLMSHPREVAELILRACAAATVATNGERLTV